MRIQKSSVVFLLAIIAVVIGAIFWMNQSLQEISVHTAEAQKRLDQAVKEREMAEADRDKAVAVLAEQERQIESGSFLSNGSGAQRSKKGSAHSMLTKEDRDKRESQIGTTTVWGADYLPYFDDRRDSAVVVRKDENGKTSEENLQGFGLVGVQRFMQVADLLINDSEAHIAWTTDDDGKMTAVIEFVRMPIPDEQELRSLLTSIPIKGKTFGKEVRKTTNGTCIVYVPR